MEKQESEACGRDRRRREETLVFKVQIFLLRLVPQGIPEDQKITISIPWVDRKYRLKGTVADT